ncbi:MAG: hypothetical protein Pg6B_03030 [Candidatus Azobacteroides pseudotrichonymphae]|nr:MAG: hypothetical protein Pg6B_03030 [Candidatus Azobacteroides pseudotrichonymphae]
MNRVVFLFLLLVFMIDYLQSRNSIIDDLQTNLDSSGGVICIRADSAVMNLVGTTPSGYSRFRIQVFMSNDPCKARVEASSKQALIKNVFPSLPTYLVYKSPNWKLLVGNFADRDKADSFKKRLQKEFPKFGKEMCVIIVNDG